MVVNKMSFTNCNCIFVVLLIIPVTDQAPNGSFFGETLAALFDKREFPVDGGLPVLNRKIFRGSRVSISEHPYVASVRRLVAHYVTGTVLTKNLVVTVAHPLHGINIADLGVVVGENYSDRGTTLFTVVLMIFHENFNPYEMINDLVLLRVYGDIHYRVAVKPIMLAYDIASLNGHTGFVTGWGRCDRKGTELCMPKSTRFFRNEKSDPMLRTVKFTFRLGSKYCQEYDAHDLKIDKRMFCAGPARAGDILTPCMAVPGAPLVVDGQLAGIQSWGFGCGYIHDLPIIYTNLEAYQRWIVHNIPILRSITKENLSDLFYGTRVNQISTYLYESRAQFTAPFSMRGNQDMQPLEVDYKLIHLRGRLLDIRDFIDKGKFHEEKLSLYEILRQSEHRLDQIREMNLRNRVHNSAPFLSDTALTNTGLEMKNGTLTDSDTDDSDYTNASYMEEPSEEPQEKNDY